MQRYKILVLTDHRKHSKENSLYDLVHSMNHHQRCAQLDIATRGDQLNDLFFKEHILKSLFVVKGDDDFAFHEDGRAFKKHLRKENLNTYDVVWLRMPPPLSKEFLNFLKKQFPQILFINDPDGIYKTGSKEFLINFPELCPPMQICRSIEDIINFKNRFPIVLKPFRDYGGKGIIRIDGDQVWEGNKQSTFTELVDKLSLSEIEYLGVKFLKNVSKGDKRIVVVDGKIMGASLRLPAKDSWICNVSMGGSSNHSEVVAEEIKIVESVNPKLSEMGIVMYGIDTLMGDDGLRILSEINTTSIGGLPQIGQMTGRPLVKEAVDLIWSYVHKKISKEDAISK